MLDSVQIVHNDHEYIISRSRISVSKKYVNQYSFEKQIIVHDHFSESQFGAFLNFLENGQINMVLGDIGMIFLLMQEWECHPFAFLALKELVQMSQHDSFLVINGITYSFSSGAMILSSNLYREHFRNEPNSILVIKTNCFAHSIELFFQIVHNIRFTVTDEQFNDVMRLIELFQCEKLSYLLTHTQKKQNILRFLDSLGDEGLNLNFFEEEIAADLPQYLLEPSFCKLPIGTIIRIIQKRKVQINTQSFINMIKSISKEQGIFADYLLRFLKIDSKDSICDFIEYYSTFENHRYIYDYFNSLISNEKTENLKDKMIYEEKIDGIKQEFEKKIFGFQQKIGQLQLQHDIQLSQITEMKMEFKKLKQKPDNFEPDIHIASYNGNIETIVYMNNSGYSLESVFEKETIFDGWLMYQATPIFFAILKGNHNIVEYLIQNRANVNAKKKFNRTPLHLASHKGHFDIVELLITHNAIVNSKDDAVLIRNFYGHHFILHLKMDIWILLKY